MNDKEKKFVRQSEVFLTKLLHQKGICSLDKVEDITNRLTFPLVPVVIENIISITADEKKRLVDSYEIFGVAYFISPNSTKLQDNKHPLFVIADQLKDKINLSIPLIHPLEGHEEAVKRFGEPDATVKIYNLPKPNDKGYREVAETNLAFEVHSDGLGSGNTVENFILYSDEAPLFGGFTFFYDLLSLSLCLAKQDYEAFQQLFLPDAITAIRPRGKGAIKVVSPILYLDDDEKPNAFFRKDSGEYLMKWHQGDSAFNRGLEFIMQYTNPFCNGSYFINFTRKGHGIISKNLGYAHARTPFIDGNVPDHQRLLSRKWFMKSMAHQNYKHVPGMFISKEFAELYPEYFGADKLVGEWNYDIDTDTNNRIK